MQLHQGIKKSGIMGFCDPCPGEPKQLLVEYTFNGQNYKVKIYICLLFIFVFLHLLSLLPWELKYAYFLEILATSLQVQWDIFRLRKCSRKFCSLHMSKTHLLCKYILFMGTYNLILLLCFLAIGLGWWLWRVSNSPLCPSYLIVFFCNDSGDIFFSIDFFA